MVEYRDSEYSEVLVIMTCNVCLVNSSAIIGGLNKTLECVMDINRISFLYCLA